MSSIKLDKSTIAVVYAQMQASKSTLGRALTSLNNWAKVESGLNIFSRIIYSPGLKDGDPPLIDFRDNAKSYINSANSICTHVGYLDKVMDAFDSILDALDGIKDAIEDFELQPICLPGEDPSKYGFVTSIKLSGRYGYNEEMGIDITSELMDPEYMLATLGNSGDISTKDMKKAYKEMLNDYGNWVNEQTKTYVTEQGALMNQSVTAGLGIADQANSEKSRSESGVLRGLFGDLAAVWTFQGAAGLRNYFRENPEAVEVLKSVPEIVDNSTGGFFDMVGGAVTTVAHVVNPGTFIGEVAGDSLASWVASDVSGDVSNAYKVYIDDGSYKVGPDVMVISGEISKNGLKILTGEGVHDKDKNLSFLEDSDRSTQEDRASIIHAQNEGHYRPSPRQNIVRTAVDTAMRTGLDRANHIREITVTGQGAETPKPVPVVEKPAPPQTSTPAQTSGGNSSPAPAQPAPAAVKPAEAPKTNTSAPAETPKPAAAEVPKTETKPTPEAKLEPTSTPSEGSSKPNIEIAKPDVKTTDVPNDKAATSAIDLVKNHADSDKVASAGVAAMTIGVGGALSKTVPGVGIGGGSSVTIPEVALGGGGNMNVPSATTATIGGSPGGMGGTYGMGGGSGGGYGTSGYGDLSMSNGGVTQTGSGLTGSNSGTIPNSGKTYDNNTFADQLEQSTRNQEARNSSTVKAGTNSTDAKDDDDKNNSKKHKDKSVHTNAKEEKIDDSEARKKMQDLSKKIEAPDANKEEDESIDKKLQSDVENKQETVENKSEEKIKTTTKEELSAGEGLVGSNAGYITSKDESISKIAVEITAGEILISAVLFALKVLNILAFILVIVAIVLLYTTYKITHKKIIEKRKKQYLISIEKVKKEEAIEKVSEEVTTEVSTPTEVEQEVQEQVTVEQQVSSEENVVEENKEVEEENNKDLIIPPMKDNPNFEEFGTGLDFVDKK